MSRRFTRLTIAICTPSLVWAMGCVSVRTPDTDVKVGITSVTLPGGDSKDPHAPPYAKPLRRVSAQQSEVAKELAQQDWEDLVSESSDWIAYTRELTGYARTSHDPALFVACCDQLTRHAQGLREAATRRDAAGANRALAACDAPLNRLMQSFPLTSAAPGQAVMASPPPAAPPPAQPQPTANRKPMVP